LLGGDDAIPLEKENGKPSTSKQEVEEKKEETIPKVEEKEEEQKENKRPTIILHSQKMKELKDLLLAEKLNTHAISLHLTAQSQVQVGKKGRSDSDGGIRPKRARRE
jgi:menin